MSGIGVDNSRVGGTRVWPRTGPRSIARGASPWYAGAITLEYNSALKRAKVPVRGRQRLVREVLALFAVAGAREHLLFTATPFGAKAWGKGRVACVVVPGATSPWLFTADPFGAESKTAQHQKAHARQRRSDRARRSLAPGFHHQVDHGDDDRATGRIRSDAVAGLRWSALS